jgi:hypothetical protein
MEGKTDSEVHAGVIPRSIDYIFDALEKSASEYPSNHHDHWIVVRNSIYLIGLRYTVRVSHLELYNEELHDLLSNEVKPLRIYDDIL